ncbi:Spermidine/putrescine import ATP-binding protein PotA [compost metagenome]
MVDVVKEFEGNTVVKSLNLSVARNEMFALLGSSGCGKSTLLRMMAGLETPSSGRILLDGEDITDLPPHRRPVNMMFQSYALFPHMTVTDNVAYGLKREGVAKAEIRDRVSDALQLVQMQDYAKRKPHQLSGGQQQRVALARTLIKRPKLLLLDEPMSALDKKIRQQTQFELGNILYKVGVTCVMVTHDQEEAMTMADRLAVMDAGRIVQLGSPEEVYEYPNSSFCAGFIGSTNMLQGSLLDDDCLQVDCLDMAAPLELPSRLNGYVGMPVSLSLRPERIAVSAQPFSQRSNTCEGRLEQIAYMGSYTLFYLRLDSGRLMGVHVSHHALHDLEQRPTYGDRLHLAWQPDSLVMVSQ